MEETWLNPDFATRQFIAITMIILGSLVILSLVFGALLYGILAAISRWTDWRRTHSRDVTDTDKE